MHLEAVEDALEGTGFILAVTRSTPGRPPEGDEGEHRAGVPARLSVVSASIRRSALHGEWDPTDLVARVRGGGRRFPAHRPVQAVDSPPLWWWMHEFFEGPSEEPRWYSPVPLPANANDVPESAVAMVAAPGDAAPPTDDVDGQVGAA